MYKSELIADNTLEEYIGRIEKLTRRYVEKWHGMEWVEWHIKACIYDAIRLAKDSNIPMDSALKRIGKAGEEYLRTIVGNEARRYGDRLLTKKSYFDFLCELIKKGGVYLAIFPWAEEHALLNRLPTTPLYEALEMGLKDLNGENNTH
ncbi:MAG TPA: hypothetical protein ENG42_02335 [Candidatus Aenigmarchaeota archaeon]|nr:hypothetical protein [Candidatus Aenigmarchaeota archaeon]